MPPESVLISVTIALRKASFGGPELAGVSLAGLCLAWEPGRRQVDSASSFPGILDHEGGRDRRGRQALLCGWGGGGRAGSSTLPGASGAR